MKVLDIKDDFGPYCCGRYPKDAYVNASFLEEAFGGLIRAGLSYEDFCNRVVIRTDDEWVKDKILEYVKDAEWRKT